MPTLWTCVCVMLQAKGVWKCAKGYRTWDGEINLDYLGGTNFIIWALKSRACFPGLRLRDLNCKRNLTCCCWLWWWRGHESGNWGQPLEAEHNGQTRARKEMEPEFCSHRNELVPMTCTSLAQPSWHLHFNPMKLKGEKPAKPTRLLIYRTIWNMTIYVALNC